MPRLRHLLPTAVLAAATLALPAAAGAATSAAYIDVSSAPTGITAGPDGQMWFGEASGVGRIGLDGTLAEFPGAAGTGGVQGIAPGPDQGLWYAQWGATGNAAGIGRVAVTGAASALYRAPMSASATPTSIVSGPDGNLWFTEQGTGEIGRITPAGTITEISLGGGAQPYGIAVGSDGNLWATDIAGRRVWKVTTSGAHTPIDLGFTPGSLAAGPDGNLWIADQSGAIVRLRPSTGARTSFSAGLPSAAKPMLIAAGPDGALWFTSGYVNGSQPGVGRIATDGTISFSVTGGKPLVPAAGADGAVWFTDLTGGRVGRLTVQAPALSGATAAPTSATTASVAAQVKANGPGATALVQYGPTSAYGTSTAAVPVPATAAPAPVAIALGGLRAGAYHARLVVSNAAGTTTGPDVSFTAAAPAAAPAPAPALGKAVVVAPVAGTVRVLVKGRWVTLGGATKIPVGATFDTSKGTVALTSVKDAKGTRQTGEFHGGRFQVRQAKSSKPVTELVLKGALSCSAKASAARVTASAAAKKTVKRLWGKDNHGSFRTRGRDSVATVRGTQWLTEETCAGTLTRVKQGAVDVRNLHTGKTVRVKAGHRYLARRAR